MRWGDDTWVQAWATVALFVAAFVAGVLAYRVYRIEHRRDERRDDERRREQASHVAAWVEWRDPPATDPRWRSTFDPLPAGSYKCILRNSSPLPVYDVEVMYLLTTPQDTETLGDIPPNIDVLPPGEKTEEIDNDALRSWEERREHGWSLRAEIEFTDASGQRWLRDHYGVLIEDPFDYTPPSRRARLRAFLRRARAPEARLDE